MGFEDKCAESLPEQQQGSLALLRQVSERLSAVPVEKRLGETLLLETSLQDVLYRRDVSWPSNMSQEEVEQIRGELVAAGWLGKDDVLVSLSIGSPKCAEKRPAIYLRGVVSLGGNGWHDGVGFQLDFLTVDDRIYVGSKVFLRGGMWQQSLSEDFRSVFEAAEERFEQGRGLTENLTESELRLLKMIGEMAVRLSTD